MLNKSINGVTPKFTESERSNKKKTLVCKFKNSLMRIRKFPSIPKKEKINYNIIKNKLSKSCNKGNRLKDILYEEKSNIKSYIRGLYTINTIDQKTLTEKSNSKLTFREFFFKKISNDKNKSNKHFYKKAIGKKTNKYQPRKQNDCLLSYVIFNSQKSGNKTSKSINHAISKNINNIFMKKIIKKSTKELNNNIKLQNNIVIWHRNKNYTSHTHDKKVKYFYSATNSKKKIGINFNDLPSFKSLGEKYERHSEDKHSANSTNFNLTDDISKNMTKSINKYYEDSVKNNDFFNYNIHNTVIKEKTENNFEKSKSKSKNKDRKSLKIILGNEFKKYFTINKNNFFIKKNIPRNKSRNNGSYIQSKKQKTISNNLPLKYITNSNCKEKIRWNYTTFSSQNSTLSKYRSSYKNRSKLIYKKDIYKITLLKKKHDNINRNQNTSKKNSFLNVEKSKTKFQIYKQKIFNVDIKFSKPKSKNKIKKIILNIKNKNSNN